MSMPGAGKSRDVDVIWATGDLLKLSPHIFRCLSVARRDIPNSEGRRT